MSPFSCAGPLICESLFVWFQKIRNYDVIVLDVSMPNMDGLETLKEIKKLTPLVEVIMLTGHATIQTAINGIKLGACDFLMKPRDIEQLVGKVEEATRKKRIQEEIIEEALKQEILSKYGPFYYV